MLGESELFMKIVPLKCPTCNATLNIENGHKIIYCSYCGSQLYVDDENRTFTVHIHDEAELKRLEYEKQRYEAEVDAKERPLREYKKNLKRWRKACAIIILLESILIGLGFVFSSKMEDFFGMWIGLLMIGAAIVAFIRPHVPDNSRSRIKEVIVSFLLMCFGGEIISLLFGALCSVLIGWIISIFK